MSIPPAHHVGCGAALNLTWFREHSELRVSHAALSGTALRSVGSKSVDRYRLNPFLSREQIASIVKDLADRISNDYRERQLVLVCILKGAFMFLSDLARSLQMPVQIDFIRLSSYGKGMETCRVIEIAKDIETPIEGKDVLIVEDIVDRGRTLQFLKDRLALATQ